MSIYFEANKNKLNLHIVQLAAKNTVKIVQNVLHVVNEFQKYFIINLCLQVAWICYFLIFIV